MAGAEQCGHQLSKKRYVIPKQTKQPGSDSKRKEQAIKKKENLLFIWMKAGSQKIGHELMGTLHEVNVVSAFKIGRLRAAPYQCVIVMDNTSFHTRQDMQQAIINTWHLMEYLPPFSPDLNPIEHQ